MKKKIYLISCSARKYKHTAQAKVIYAASTLFRLTYIYVKERLKADPIYILSAKYGLIRDTDVIEWYNDSLLKKTVRDRKLWALGVSSQLNNLMKGRSQDYELIAFAGNKYLEYLRKDYSIEEPLKGLPIGKRLKWLKEKLSDI